MNILFLALLLPLAAYASDGRAIKSYPLDPQILYKIPVPFEGKGTCTVMFPSGLTHVASASITKQPTSDPRANFLISYEAGNYYFSLRAVRKEAQDRVNVIYQNKVYVIEFYSSDNPLNSVSFFNDSTTRAGAKRGLTDAQLIGIIDKAKAYHLIKDQQPEMSSQIDYTRPARICLYDGFRVLIDEVFRFDEADTLVFHCVLDNSTDKEILYRPDLLSVRLHNNIYYASMVQASGVMPPHSATPIFFAITNTADGYRNNLAAKNDWNILVARETPLEITNSIASLNDKLLPDLKPTPAATPAKSDTAK